MHGLSQSIRRTAGWGFHLMLARIVRRPHVPASRLPMRNVSGEAASHALPGTPQPNLVRMAVNAA
jgi:hypothetical protein